MKRLQDVTFIGGPYDGRYGKLRSNIEKTLTFRAKRFKGYYTRNCSEGRYALYSGIKGNVVGYKFFWIASD